MKTRSEQKVVDRIVEMTKITYETVGSVILRPPEIHLRANSLLGRNRIVMDHTANLYRIRKE